jgi:phenylalanyl-tRNA synthetase alpha chain
MSTTLDSLRESLATAVAEAAAALAACTQATEVADWRVRLLGKKGVIPGAYKELGGLPPADRPALGQVINQVRDEAQRLLDAAQERLTSASASTAPALDVTLPGRRRYPGRRHPLTATIEECISIFRRLGFSVATGPDIEDEYHNFDALNTPATHPSRDLQDTFFMPDGRLLRTQTSPVQIRVMEQQPPPVRIIAPGRCYRRDTVDATHSMTFTQIEGLYVDRGVSLANLKGMLLTFAHEIFGKDVKIRIRPHFFPFTEPSIEGDVYFPARAGKPGRWLEIWGAGMVHPNVLRGVGYDPEEVSGYAFGMGIERIAMIRYGIPDIRLFYENDLRFLQQF